ncbi:hypothetical protein BHO39_003019 [Escherichia coli]|nr:hypothetical protein [Escherichia coli]
MQIGIKKIAALYYASDKALFGDLTEREDFAALLREKIADVYALIN